MIVPRYVPRGGGGGGGVPFRPIAVAPAALVDPEGILNAGSSGFSTATSQLTLVFAAHTAGIRDGLQEALARYRWPLLDVFPTFDPSKHSIEVLLQNPTFTHQASIGAGVYAAITDSTTVDASLQGSGVTWGTNTLTLDFVGPIDEDNRPSTKSMLTDAVSGTFFFGVDSSGNNQAAVVVRALAEGTTRWEAAGVSQPTTGLLRTGNTKYLEIGAFHSTTTSPVGYTAVFDVGVRLL